MASLPPSIRCKRASRMFRSSYDQVTSVLRTARSDVTKSVADAANRLDRRRHQPRREEFPPHAREMDVHRAGLDEAIAAPHQIEQFLAAEHAPWRGDQG